MAGIGVLLAVDVVLWVVPPYTQLCPGPMLAVWFGLMWLVLPMAVFFLWSHGDLDGPDQLPRVEAVVVALLSAANLWWFAAGWEGGIRYQGGAATRGLLIANGLLATALVLMLAQAAVQPSRRWRLILRLGICLWVQWCAFPWLGEPM